MYNVLIEPEVKTRLKELKTLLLQSQGEKKGLKTFQEIISAVDNLQLYELGTSIRERYFVDCPDNWYLLYTNKNYLIFSRTVDTVKVLKIYDERQDFIYDLFGIEMRSQESKDYWGE